MKSDLVFVIPVYNDWEAVGRLQAEIETAISDKRLHFVLVNDSSEHSLSEILLQDLKNTSTIIELSRNLGHQKAIAAGLAYVNEHFSSSYIVVMDGDGEDKPSDILRLVNHAAEFKGVVFAQRSRRSEGFGFRFFYQLYKVLFVLFTGKRISFGNFCVIPEQRLRKLTHVPDIWNHFSGGVIRSGIPYTAIPSVRGKRYAGSSKMNFHRLILHGLSAVSVYADFMSVRLILLSFLLIITTGIGIAVVILVKLTTNLAIPGWATFSVLGLGILFFLALFLGLFLLFNVLALKTQKGVIPAKDYKDYIVDVQTVDAKKSALHKTNSAQTNLLSTTTE